MVIRHPVRPRDERSDDGVGQIDGEKEEKREGKHGIGLQEGLKGDGAVPHVDANGVKMRLDSGFFRAASVDRDRRRRG